jgi:EAL domain-containing protein (putative c-di-GMP-specific phosphodiesterase class I)
MHENAVKRLELATDLRIATERKEFQLFYQPIVRIEDKSLDGFEGLMRWNHPTRGLVSPGEFIPLAETTGLIVPMTVDILRSGCDQLVEWQREMPPTQNLNLSLNLSAIHLADTNVLDHIETVINESGIKPSSLKLEITESSVLENAEQTIEVLWRIKALGVRLSIDDFGTGYSSLSYLHRFPVDTLKIDRSFVSTMEDGSESEEIVKTVLTLAKALNLSVIAEGIETGYQYRRLQTLGCEYAQGYLFSRPVSAADAAILLDGDHDWLTVVPQSPLLAPIAGEHKTVDSLGLLLSSTG